MSTSKALTKKPRLSSGEISARSGGEDESDNEAKQDHFRENSAGRFVLKLVFGRDLPINIFDTAFAENMRVEKFA